MTNLYYEAPSDKIFDEIKTGAISAPLAAILSDEARTAIRERMVAGGTPEYFIYF